MRSVKEKVKEDKKVLRKTETTLPWDSTNRTGTGVQRTTENPVMGRLLRLSFCGRPPTSAVHAKASVQSLIVAGFVKVTVSRAPRLPHGQQLSRSHEMISSAA